MALTRSRRYVGTIVVICVLTLAFGVRLTGTQKLPVEPHDKLQDGGSALETDRAGETDSGAHHGPSADQRDERHGDVGDPETSNEVTDWTHEDVSGGEVRLAAGNVPTVACDLVVGYRDEGDCLLRHAGYLDLLGDVWGCVVQGPGWVDVCVVSQGEGENECVVRVKRLGTDS